ncbi:helix-turn-helix transcriptional regulator [Clostridium sp. D53t1_180928_C8]|uniref:helix-turn-helix transcriptional regulator n=1 Tax=Clostridium sp. D53t1_180928_C8 TaxID=2787101 RepID=UPI0018A9DB57|nr:helix-turn-helix transcriptional regulator [Clostridium sp. D53t1_180928_C8]
MIAIKVLRIIAGDTQEKVAKYIGCSVYTYNKKENGKSKFNVEELKKISILYNVSIEKILDEKRFTDLLLRTLQS